MPGLRETFDVAKRLGLFIYIAQNTRTQSNYQNLLKQYVSDYDLLKDALDNYRTNCVDDIARSKMQSGLVRKKSRISLSKYVRVAAELGIIDFEYSSKASGQGIIRPNNLTRVIQALLEDEDSVNDFTFSFELSSATKVMFFNQLLVRDAHYIIPLIFAIGLQKTGSRVSTIRKVIMNSYGKLLLESLVSSSSNIPDKARKSLYARIPFIRKTVQMMDEGFAPSRGFLHLIDPRLHWLYDLKLVDYNTLCKNGTVIPHQFWNIEEANVADYVTDVVRNPTNMLAKFAGTIVELQNEAFDKILESSLRRLAPFFDKFIPLSALEPLVRCQYILSGIHSERGVLVNELRKLNYPLFRDWRGEVEYVDVSNR